MLNLEQLKTRLMLWSAEYRAAHPRREPSPIVLYQSLFALVHDLKSSVLLSDDPQIKGLNELVLEIEVRLRALAYDELELDGAGNDGLFKTACGLADLESLQYFLESTGKSASKPKTAEPAVLKLEFPWETMARARARSASRHGYRFFVRDEAISLAGMTAHDRQLRDELRPDDGILVIRRLDPRPQSQGTDLEMDARLLAAFPTMHANTSKKGWTSL